MILVVMVGMSILFGAIIVYSDNFQSGRGSSILESVTVEDVHFIDSNKVELTLYNTGKVELHVSNVYIEGDLATVSPAKIMEGQHKTVSVTTPNSFVHGGSYDFKIVTERGTGFEGTYVW